MQETEQQKHFLPIQTSSPFTCMCGCGYQLTYEIHLQTIKYIADGQNSVNFVDENYDEKYSLTTFFP